MKERIERLLELPLAQSEVFTLRSELKKVELLNGKLLNALSQETQGIALRLKDKNRIGFSSAVGEFEDKQLLKDAQASLTTGEKGEYSFPRMRESKSVKSYDPKIAELSSQELFHLAEEANELLKSAYPRAEVRVEASKVVSSRSIYNTQGLKIEIPKTSFSISISFKETREDGIILISNGITKAQFIPQLPQQIAKKVLERANNAQRLASLRSGETSVVFSPQALWVVVLPLIVALNGKTIAQKISPLTGKLGQKIFSSKLTLGDDPFINWEIGSTPYDDEGVRTRANTLIEEGLVRRFYFDLKTASLCNQKPTGNGKRNSITSPPSPSLHNLIWQPGKESYTEFLSQIKEGLWIDTPLALGQGNLLSGDFAHPLSLAFKIEQGKLVGRVREVSIAGNIYSLLRELSGVSKEREWQNGPPNGYFPYVFFEKFPIIVR